MRAGCDEFTFSQPIRSPTSVHDLSGGGFVSVSQRLGAWLTTGGTGDVSCNPNHVGGEPVTRSVNPVGSEETVAGQQAEHGHLARPEQFNESFARGQTELPHDPDVQPGPNYARGVAAVDEPHGEQPGRFSRGQEELPEDHPEKLLEGDFSVGLTQAPTSR